jgi:endonuclease YncB( thermonuclease family)
MSLPLLAGCALVFSGTIVGGLAWPQLRDHLRPRAGSAWVAHVIDGDTFVLASGERVRILNIDTPEMPPRAHCHEEAKLALAAKARLAQLLSRGGVSLSSQGEDRDRFGRLLRRAEVGGRDVGDILMQEGLAQPWRGRKALWC